MYGNFAKYYRKADIMKRFLKIITVTLIIIIIILFSAFDNRLKVVNYKIKTDRISSSVKIALVADLHCCLYGENQSELIDAIDKYKPDAVLFGGDIFDDYYINNNSHILINNIAQKYKTYYVSGNHEWWSEKMYEHFEYLENAGVTILRGDSDYLTVRDNTIVISGVDDPEVNVYDSSHKTYEEQLKIIADEINSEYYNILLAHRPENARQYFNYDFDLVLSGHAHGGQGRIPFILNGFYAPNQGFFPELAGGIYDFDGKKMIVSRGLSKENTELPRIFNRPELVFVSIKN